VGFIANGNPQIRLVALENLIPYSLSQPSIFKAEDMKPVKNLTILLQDHSVRDPGTPRAQDHEWHSGMS
jgi:hypothetical protein